MAPVPRNSARPSLRKAVIAALAEGPLTFEELRARLSEEFELGDRWKARLRTAVGTDNRLVCRVGPGTYDLLERRLEGVTFRHRLSEAEVSEGAILAEPDLPALAGWDGDVRVWERTVFTDEEERPLTARPATLQLPLTESVSFGRLASFASLRIVRGLGPFLASRAAEQGDDLCVRLNSPAARRMQLWIEKGSARSGGERAVRAADQEVASIGVRYVRRCGGMALPVELLAHLAGMRDCRRGIAPHLPTFCFHDQGDLAYDGLLYMLPEVVRARAEAGLRPLFEGFATAAADRDGPPLPSKIAYRYLEEIAPHFLHLIPAERLEAELAELDRPEVREAVEADFKLAAALLAARPDLTGA